MNKLEIEKPVPFEDKEFFRKIGIDISEDIDFKKQLERKNLAMRSELSWSEIKGKPFYDVTDNGATGDGSDDIDSINKTIYDNRSSGGRVYLPGTSEFYGASSPIIIYDNFELCGDGYSSAIRLLDGSNCNVIRNADTVNGNDNIRISGIRINGNKNNQNQGYAIYFNQSTNLHILYCYIEDACFNGIQITQGNKLWIIGNEVSSCGTGVSNQSNGIDIRKTTNRTIVSQNFVHDCNKNGIRIHRISGTSPHYSVVSENICNNNGHIGLAIADSRCIVVSSNVCVSNSNNGLDFNGLDFCQIIVNIAYNNSIHGINPDTCTEIEVNNNICWNNRRAGIYLISVDNSVCNSNLCVNNGQEGFAAIDDGILVTDSDNNVISGNRCLDKQGTKTQDYGIKEAGTSDYNLFLGNHVRGNLTGGITTTGANTDADHNKA